MPRFNSTARKRSSTRSGAEPTGDSNVTPRTEDSSLWSRLFPRDAPPAVDGAPTAVGCRLGHFRIEATIGAGGMGAVFRAVDERLDRIVALKVLSPSLSRDAGSIQRFLNEARAAARLDHDNIARVYYVGEDRGLNFIAHEFVTGRTIRDIIRDHGPLDPREAVNYALQLAAALRHTSAAGVVHRDIKPSNIIITPRGRAKLVDLGLAKKVASESFGDLTIAGTTLGTFDYISPEQAKDPRNVDVRSDIYSLGCTLYHMLAGTPPYPEGTVLQKLLDHQAKDVPDPAAKNPRSFAATFRDRPPHDGPRSARPRRHARRADPANCCRLLPKWACAASTRKGSSGRRTSRSSARSSNATWFGSRASPCSRSSLSWSTVFPRSRGAPQHKPIAFRAPPDNFDLPDEPTKSTLPATSRQPPAITGNSGPPASAPVNGSSGPKGLVAKDARDEIAPFDFPPMEPEAAFEPRRGTLRAAGRRTDPTARTDSPATPSPKPEKPPTAPPDAGHAVFGGGQRPTTRKPKRSAADDSAAPAPEISISDGGESPTPYITLEAAVADAKDGGTIELKFNGVRAVSEKPFRISGKRVTIRAGAAITR